MLLEFRVSRWLFVVVRSTSELGEPVFVYTEAQHSRQPSVLHAVWRTPIAFER